MIPPSAMQWHISLLGASSGVTGICRRHTVPAGMKCCGFLEISIKITKMHDVHLPRTPAQATMLRSFTLWLHCGYFPANLSARLPLNPAPDWSKKAGLTWRSTLRADGKSGEEVPQRTRWTETDVWWEERSRNFQMSPSSPLCWRSKALESAPLFFGQEVAQK